MMAIISAVYFAISERASAECLSSFNRVVSDRGTFARAAREPGDDPCNTA